MDGQVGAGQVPVYISHCIGQWTVHWEENIKTSPPQCSGPVIVGFIENKREISKIKERYNVAVNKFYAKLSQSFR